MHREAPRKGLDRGEQALLQADDEQAGGRLRPARALREALLARCAVLVQQGRELGKASRAQLDEITELIDVKVRLPTIDQTYPFDETRQALAHVEAGRTKGKVV